MGIGSGEGRRNTFITILGMRFPTNQKNQKEQTKISHPFFLLPEDTIFYPMMYLVINNGSMNQPPEKSRCPWCLSFDDYIQYHDKEWGVPVHDDRIHFEFLILEGAQAGLSWSTVLKKREGYRKAFADFDPKKVAKFDSVKAAKLLLDPGIIRNRLKIAAAINNAKLFLEVQKEFGSFDAYCWKFVGGKPITNRLESLG